jgi:hypothetical protein
LLLDPSPSQEDKRFLVENDFHLENLERMKIFSQKPFSLVLRCEGDGAMGDIPREINL